MKPPRPIAAPWQAPALQPDRVRIGITSVSKSTGRSRPEAMSAVTRIKPAPVIGASSARLAGLCDVSRVSLRLRAFSFFSAGFGPNRSAQVVMSFCAAGVP